MAKAARNVGDTNVVEEILTIRASKWTPAIMLKLRISTHRFSELQRDIGGISQKALTATLRNLERDGIVMRTIYATVPPRVEYELTDLGRELLIVFEAFETFASLHWHRVLAARQSFDEQPGLEDLKIIGRVSGR